MHFIAIIYAMRNNINNSKNVKNRWHSIYYFMSMNLKRMDLQRKEVEREEFIVIIWTIFFLYGADFKTVCGTFDIGQKIMVGDNDSD